MDEKITLFPELSIAHQTDVFPVVDNSATPATKKIQVQNMPFARIYNIRSYGAKGDGTTDDTTAIMAAWTAAVVNGGIVDVPEGDFLTIAGLTPNTNNANVPWQGHGRKSKIIGNGTNVPFTITGQAYVKDIVFDAAGALHAAVQTVPTESSYPSLWDNVVWQNATGYQYVNNGCEDVEYLNCETPGDESNPSGVAPAMQIIVPFGAVWITGGAIFGKVDINYQQIQVTGATIGPIFIENSSALNNTILSLDGCYLYDGGASNNSVIGTSTNLTNIHAKGCYFVGQTNRAYINGNLPAGVTVTLDNNIFIWGPATSGNNYILQASGAGTLELRSYSSGMGSATLNIFNPVSSPTTIIRNSASKKGANVASANNLVLGNDGITFHITGTTQVNLINSATWEPGTEVNLIFDGALTLKHNQTASGVNKSLLLSGSADLTTTANTRVSFIFDGTSWYEFRRTIP